MDPVGIIIFLIIGAIAGWLAGTLMKGGSFGLLGNIIVGVLGAIVGGVVFRILGLAAGGFLGETVMATVGAILLLFIVSKFKKV